jgi:hypothetical protein
MLSKSRSYVESWMSTPKEYDRGTVTKSLNGLIYVLFLRAKKETAALPHFHDQYQALLYFRSLRSIVFAEQYDDRKAATYDPGLCCSCPGHHGSRFSTATVRRVTTDSKADYARAESIRRKRGKWWRRLAITSYLASRKSVVGRAWQTGAFCGSKLMGAKTIFRVVEG